MFRARFKRQDKIVRYARKNAEMQSVNFNNDHRNLPKPVQISPELQTGVDNLQTIQHRHAFCLLNNSTINHKWTTATLTLSD